MENISKNVVDTTTGRCIGYILDVAIDYETMQLIGYYIVDSETESEFLLRTNDIALIADRFVFVEDISKLEFISDRKPSLIGKNILDRNGNDFGIVRKVVMNNGKFDKIITEKAEIMTKYIKNIGNDIIFVEFKRNKRNKNPKPIFPKNNDEIVVKIQTKTIPERVSLSSSFYLGKVVNKDIFGYNNELIVLKGEKITKAIVEKAKQHNRLNQMFFALKR